MRAGVIGSRITVLDGWRGVSILMVLAGHFSNFRFASGNAAASGSGAALALLGVNLFFFISGFIITQMALKEREHQSYFSIRNFYLRRIFRILPPFLLFLFAVLITAGLGQIIQPARGVLFSSVFLCDTGVSCGWFVGHTWSLAVEEQFYLFFPLLFALLGWRVARAAGVLIVCALALPVIHRIMMPGSALLAWWSTFLWPFVFICCGCLAACFENSIKTLSSSHWAGVISIAGAVVILAVIVAAGVGFQLGSLASRFFSVLNRIAVPAAVTWLVVSSIHRETAWNAVLTNRMVLWIGTISYSLYLWQQLFTGPPGVYLGDAFMFWPLMFVFAWCSYRFIERPFIRLGKEITRGERLAIS